MLIISISLLGTTHVRKCFTRKPSTSTFWESSSLYLCVFNNMLSCMWMLDCSSLYTDCYWLCKKCNCKILWSDVRNYHLNCDWYQSNHNWHQSHHDWYQSNQIVCYGSIVRQCHILLYQKKSPSFCLVMSYSIQSHNRSFHLFIFHTLLNPLLPPWTI